MCHQYQHLQERGLFRKRPHWFQRRLRGHYIPNQEPAKRQHRLNQKELRQRYGYNRKSGPRQKRNQK